MNAKILAINELYKDIKEPFLPYGADFVIKKYLECKNPPLSRVTWAHGWAPDWQLYAPEFITGTKDTFFEKHTYIHLVAKKLQENSLKNYGYKNTFSVGLPYIYSDYSDLGREGDSCLFVPCHSTFFDNAFHFQDKVIENLIKLKKEYKYVYILMHPADLKIGNYNKLLNNYNFIIGAHWQDSNALPRIKTIFNIFENVVTNGLGSHVFYSGFLNIKVKIIPELFFIPGKDPILLQGRDHIYEKIILDWSLEKVKDAYGKLFESKPQNIKNLSDYELGLENMRNSCDFLKLIKKGLLVNTARNLFPILRKGRAMVFNS